MALERLKDIVGRVSFRLIPQVWALTLPGTWYCFLCLLHWVACWESWTWEAKNVLLSAPQLLLTREWKFLCPALCSHHRCQLQRYVSPPPPPPQPWHMYLKRFYQPMGRLHRAIWPSPCSQQGADASAFLRLPVELRNMIYVYASGAKKYRIDYGYLETYHRRNGFEEDAISFQLIDDPIIALHGQNPPTNLLLVCKTIYYEARQQFLATTAFEVHPLTPRADSLAYGHLISLADYRAYVLLGTSVFASTMQKVRLRIDISRFLSSRVKRPFGPYDRLKIISMYDEIGLKACTEMLTWGSKILCKALKKSVPNLRLVEICWVDDFPDEISPQDLEMRASVLQPFSTLEFVDVRIKDLVIPSSGRKEVSKMIKECLGVGPQPEPGGYLFLGVDKL